MSLNKIIEEMIATNISWISSQQRDGAFAHEGINSETYSPFFTAMILLCLRETSHLYPTVKPLITQGWNYLSQQSSDGHLWNYLGNNPSSPYPYDLDDTFLCLLCKKIYYPESFTVEDEVASTHLLIRNEVRPGGPYYTWDSIPKNEYWDNVDPVVNSTIHYFLSEQGIHLSPLETYLDDYIEQGHYSSEFYTSPFVVIYFLSRNYTGKKSALLRETLWKRCSQGTWGTLTENLCALISLIRLGEKKDQIKKFGTSFLEIHHETLTRDPFFCERITSTHRYDASCRTLTVALHTEFLTLYKRLFSFEKNIPNSSDTQFSREYDPQPFLEASLQFFNHYPEIKARCRDAFHEWGNGHLFQQSIQLPLVCVQHLRKDIHSTLSPSTLSDIISASILGWLGYTLGDAIFDGEHTPQDIPLMLSCCMTSMHIFQNLKEPMDHDTFLSYFHTLHTTWMREVHSPTKRFTMTIRRTDLPPYLFESQAPLLTTEHGKKSLGIFLGPLILLGFLDLSERERLEQVYYLHEFGLHYLTVKQLGDDAHDWYEDLCKGYLNPIGILVLREYFNRFPHAQSLHVHQEEAVLHTLFWEYVFFPTLSSMRAMLETAKDSLNHLTIFKKDSFFTELLQQEAFVIDRAHDHYLHSKKFIETYHTSS